MIHYHFTANIETCMARVIIAQLPYISVLPNVLAKVGYSRNKRAMMALGRSPEYHWDQIISKSVHRFSRRSPFKIFFLFIALGAILFNRAERFEQFL